MTLLLGFGAVNTGNNLLYLLVSALLGFMSIAGMMGNWNLNRYHFEIEAPPEIYAGIETLLTVRIGNNRRHLHGFLLDIIAGEQLTDHCGHLSLLKQGETATVTIPVTFNQRGEQPLQRLTIRSTFPINFFIRSRGYPIDHSITVFPRPLACRPDQASSTQVTGDSREIWRKGLEGDISHIGDYQGNEPLKMIHWKLSARHDNLKIKELSAMVEQPVEIDPTNLPGSTIEQQLCCAAFLINDFSRRQYPVGLKLGTKVLPAATGRQHRYQLLTELARYGHHHHTT